MADALGLGKPAGPVCAIQRFQNADPSLSVQAQARFNESNQKLDLLKYSLEQRLNELPKNHPKSSVIVEELSLVASPALSPRQSIISTPNQYSTVAKPAALTGKTRPSQIYAWEN